MEQKLHTPEGVRDIYNKECETKLALQKKLKHRTPSVRLQRYTDADI